MQCGALDIHLFKRQCGLQLSVLDEVGVHFGCKQVRGDRQPAPVLVAEQVL